MQIRNKVCLNGVIGLLSILFSATSLAMAKCDDSIYGILTPMISESFDIEKAMASKEVKIIDDVKYHVGKILGKKVVLVNSGIGLVNAAAITTSLIKDFHPCKLLLSGTAGSINKNLKTGDVVIAKDVFNADYGKLTSHGIVFNIANLNPQDSRQFLLVYKLDDIIKKMVSSILANPNYKIILGSIADSDNFPNSIAQIDLLRTDKVDVIAMESAAFSQVCWLFKTQCLIIRGVSNVAGENITDQGAVLAAKNAATVAMSLIGNS